MNNNMSLAERRAMLTEEILRQLVAEGKSNPEIGALFGIHSNDVSEMRTRYGIPRCGAVYSKARQLGAVGIAALVEKGAIRKMRGARFEDSPEAMRDFGTPGALPRLQDYYALGGGSFAIYADLPA